MEKEQEKCLAFCLPQDQLYKLIHEDSPFTSSSSDTCNQCYVCVYGYAGGRYKADEGRKLVKGIKNMKVQKWQEEIRNASDLIFPKCH